MTEEPNYTYVKGQGWVVQPDEPAETMIVYGRNGKPVRLEMRWPKDGEMFIVGLPGWSIEQYARHIMNYSWDVGETRPHRESIGMPSVCTITALRPGTE